MEISCPNCGAKQETSARHMAVCEECQTVIRMPARREEKPKEFKARRKINPYNGSFLPEQCGGGCMSPKPGI